MLTELSVENFALVEKLRLVFGPGLNLLTGETGAGKSILLDALGMVLGEKTGADAEAIANPVVGDNSSPALSPARRRDVDPPAAWEASVRDDADGVYASAAA